MELKPCPFCGGDAEVRYATSKHDSTGWTSNIYRWNEPGFIKCTKCDSRTARYSRVNVAVNKWNRRAEK